MSQLTFILPKKNQASPLVKFIYSENYVDEAAKSICPRCRVSRIARTCAQGYKVTTGNPVYLAFAFCPSCKRVKATTKTQERILSQVTDIRPLGQIAGKEAVTQ